MEIRGSGRASILSQELYKAEGISSAFRFVSNTSASETTCLSHRQLYSSLVLLLCTFRIRGIFMGLYGVQRPALQLLLARGADGI